MPQATLLEACSGRSQGQEKRELVEKWDMPPLSFGSVPWPLACRREPKQLAGGSLDLAGVQTTEGCWGLGRGWSLEAQWWTWPPDPSSTSWLAQDELSLPLPRPLPQPQSDSWASPCLCPHPVTGGGPAFT